MMDISKTKMTLDDAIKHLDELLVPERKWKCDECRQEHEQLREWLCELRLLKKNKEM